MMKTFLSLAMLLGSSTMSAAQVRPALAIGPKQDDPRTCDAAGSSNGGGLSVPGGSAVEVGGLRPGGFNPETDPRASGGAEAIGPKQDDPRKGIIVQGGRQVLAIGPKQDDPRTADATGGSRAAGVPSGQANLSGKFNPETDPRAARGNGAVAIGPKQDDPTAPGQGLAIGPKQDDPTAPGARRAVLAMSDTCGSGGQAPLPRPGK